MRSNRGAWYGRVLAIRSGFEAREADAEAGLPICDAGTQLPATRTAAVNAVARTRESLYSCLIALLIKEWSLFTIR
jgi:hypothetical protein